MVCLELESGHLQTKYPRDNLWIPVFQTLPLEECQSLLDPQYLINRLHFVIGH